MANIDNIQQNNNFQETNLTWDILEKSYISLCFMKKSDIYVVSETGFIYKSHILESSFTQYAQMTSDTVHSSMVNKDKKIIISIVHNKSNYTKKIISYDMENKNTIECKDEYFAKSFVIVNNYIYVVDQDSIIHIYDILTLDPIGTIQLNGTVIGLKVLGERKIIVLYIHAFSILDLDTTVISRSINTVPGYTIITLDNDRFIVSFDKEEIVKMYKYDCTQLFNLIMYEPIQVTIINNKIVFFNQKGCRVVTSIFDTIKNDKTFSKITNALEIQQISEDVILVKKDIKYIFYSNSIKNKLAMLSFISSNVSPESSVSKSLLSNDICEPQVIKIIESFL